jgi:hypothetical protein
MAGTNDAAWTAFQKDAARSATLAKPAHDALAHPESCAATP